MADGIKVGLLYEWNAARSRLDFAITAAESQLISVNKRLQGLWHDLAIYIGMLVLPVVLFFFLRYVGVWLLRTDDYVVSNAFVYVLLEGVSALLLCVYLFTFPIWIYHLMKTIFLLLMNRENPEQTENLFPPEAGKSHQEWEKEATYRIEQQKLIHVLSRYYLYRDNMKQLREKIDEGSISLIDLKQELNQFTYYETIYPANEFTSPMTRKASRMVFIILFGVIAVLVLLVVR